MRRLPVLRAFAVRVPLVARIALASALLAVLVAAAFAVLVVTLSDLRATTDAATRSKDVTSATLVLEQDLLQLDASLRDHAAGGSAHPSSLVSFKNTSSSERRPARNSPNRTS